MGNIKFMGKIKKVCLSTGLRICAAVLCAGSIVLSMGAPSKSVSASSAIDDRIQQLQEQYEKQQQENEARKKQIEALGGDIKSNKEAIKLVEEQIDGINAEMQLRGQLIDVKLGEISQKRIDIENISQTIADTEAEIEKQEAEITELEAQNKANLEKFAKLARVMYMNDASSTLPILNGSDDWYSFFVYSDVVRNISGQNVKFMKELQDSIKAQETLIDAMNAEIDRLNSEKQNLEAEKKNLEDQEAALEAEKTKLASDAAEKTKYLNNLVAQNSGLQSKVNSLSAQNAEGDAMLEELNAEIEALIRQKQSGNTTQFSDGFIWPLASEFQRITTPFGYDPWRGGQHRGIDIAKNPGIQDQPIHAAQSGTVIVVSNTCKENYGKDYRDPCGGGYGNYIIIDHGGKLSTLYAHCGSINVSVGQFVNQGDVIGKVGSTGWSTGFHLHFEVRENGVAVNPFNYSYKYVF